MNMQLLKVVNGLRPRTVLALIIQDDGSLDNPGQLIYDDFSGPKTTSSVIFYNSDSIYDVWVSPTGDIWLCSSYGNVYTTANVKFPESPVKSPYDLDHDDIRNSGFDWKMYCLDAVQNGVSIWSPDGTNIFVGTYSGHVYLWDGQTWTRQETPVSQNDGKYITHFAGAAANDVYAIGSHSRELLHYNGEVWEGTAYDENKHGSMAADGIARTPAGDYYLASEGGRVWKTRDGQHFELVAADPGLDFAGLTYAHDQIILAAGEKGVYGIQEGKLLNLRNTFSAETVAGEGAQAVFVRPAKEDKDGTMLNYAVYTGAETRPWVGYSVFFGK
ncbi:WD40/YVTN/BNR-like repeat-containing protein [Chitinophaga varians]|uniref:WD40/YVTN/BNR-like repeat-containing protein n=1 Tax=Chitinophaga varians TaxID=2202339 RepID=UPI00165F9AFA|nr:hypothetical protein [Chitinophaga varians]MBC9913037.1 hypothetical protein [Chitinophaga varians]